MPNIENEKNQLHELIAIIDYITQYDEEVLNAIGMSKTKLPEQRQFIVDNYDTILEQINNS